MRKKKFQVHSRVCEKNSRAQQGKCEKKKFTAEQVRKKISSAQQGRISAKKKFKRTACEKKFQVHSRVFYPILLVSAKKIFKGTAGSVRKKNSSA